MQIYEYNFLTISIIGFQVSFSVVDKVQAWVHGVGIENRDDDCNERQRCR
jgi:hypothetical protein